MTSWSLRPPELAHLFNPAFAAVILREGASGYQQEDADGIPFGTCFLVLPLVLHKQTREALPRTIATHFHNWISEHRELRINFGLRTRAMVSATREGLLFAISRNLLSLTTDRLVPSQRKRPWSAWTAASEEGMCLDKALFLGRWLARSPDTATVMAALGVRP